MLSTPVFRMKLKVYYPNNISFLPDLRDIVPQIWKKASVVPIHKIGERSIKPNYNPINMTSMVGKLLESIVAKNILDHSQGKVQYLPNQG